MKHPVGVKALSIERPIVLVGMMGTGKTTLGRLLAGRLGLDFIDSDAVIEAEQGRSIADIFAQDGEAAFRGLESQVIGQIVATHPSAVIATGGGAVTSPQTLALLCDQTLMCWLRATPEAIFSRIKKDPNRPLLQTDDPVERLRSLLDARKDLYAKARYHIDLNNEKPLETLEKLVEIFANDEETDNSHD